MSETTEQRWDREDSGMDKNDRGRPITIGEARIAVENEHRQGRKPDNNRTSGNRIRDIY